MNFNELIVNSPSFIRTLAINLYGWRLARNRFNTDFWKYYDYLLNNLEKKTVDLNDLYFENLKNALIKSGTAPYYKRLFNEIGFDPNKMTSFDDVKVIPIMDKDTIRKNFNDFIIPDCKDKVIEHRTSGSTGERFKFMINRQLLNAWQTAFIYRHYSLLGIKPLDRRVTIGGRLFANKPPFFVYNKPENQLLLSAHHVNNSENLKIYIKEIIDYQPKFIQGHPSAIFVLADFMKRNNIKTNNKVNGIFTTGESLSEEDASLIENVFDTTLLQQYGSGENIISAIQLPDRDGYAVDIERGFIELALNEKTNGHEIIGTSFLNETFAFVRYKMNDYADPATENTVMGLPRIFKKVIGRTDDYLRNSKDEIVLPVTIRMTIKPYLGTGENYQIVQTGSKSYSLYLMGNKIIKKEIEIISSLKNILGIDSKIEIITSDSLVTAGGKLRNVINKVKN